MIMREANEKLKTPHEYIHDHDILLDLYLKAKYLSISRKLKFWNGDVMKRATKTGAVATDPEDIVHTLIENILKHDSGYTKLDLLMSRSAFFEWAVQRMDDIIHHRMIVPTKRLGDVFDTEVTMRDGSTVNIFDVNKEAAVRYELSQNEPFIEAIEIIVENLRNHKNIRLLVVFERRLEGIILVDIAEELGVSIKTVHDDIHIRIRKIIEELIETPVLRWHQ